MDRFVRKVYFMEQRQLHFLPSDNMFRHAPKGYDGTTFLPLNRPDKGAQ